MVIVLAVYDISLNRAKLQQENVKLIRLLKDRESFIMYILTIIVFIIMTVIFPKEFANISTATFHMVTYISIIQASNIKKWGKNTGNDKYNSVIDIISLMIIGGWLIRIVAEGMFNNNIYINILFLTVILILSVWGLNQLKHIENDYLSDVNNE